MGANLNMNQQQYTSGLGKQSVVPPEVKGWNWGAFLLNWIWGIGNSTYIALLMFVPLVNIFMFFILQFNNKNINIKTATKAELRQADIEGLIGRKIDIVDELKKVASIKSDVSLLGDLNIDFVDVLGFSKEDLENLWVATKATEILVS